VSRMKDEKAFGRSSRKTSDAKGKLV